MSEKLREINRWAQSDWAQSDEADISTDGNCVRMRD